MKVQLKRLGLFSLLTALYFFTFFNPTGLRHGDDLTSQIGWVTSLQNIFQSPVNLIQVVGGFPVSFFIPWLAKLPLLLLMKVFGLVLGYQTWLMLLTLLTFYTSFWAGQRRHNEKTGLIFSVLYTFSAYRTTDVFVRAALDEVLLMAVLPLILTWGYDFLFISKQKWRPFALGLSLAYYIEPQLTFYLFLLTLGIFIMQQRQTFKMDEVRTALKLALSVGLLTARSWLPYLEYSWSHPLYFPGQETFGEPVTLILDGLFSNQIYVKTVGLVGGAALVFLLYRFKQLHQHERGALYLAIACMLATTSLFPWLLLKGTPLAQLHFAWRLNLLATCFLFYPTANQLSQLGNFRQIFSGITVVLVAIHCLTLTFFYATPPLNQYSIHYPDDRALIHSIGYPVYTKDYLPLAMQDDTAFSTLKDRRYYLNGKEIKVQEHISASQVTFETYNATGKPVELELPFISYPGQQVTLNGKKIAPQTQTNGKTSLLLPAGKAKIQLRYTYTFLTQLATWLSFITACCLLLKPTIKLPAGIQKQLPLFQEKETSKSQPHPASPRQAHQKMKKKSKRKKRK